MNYDAIPPTMDLRERSSTNRNRNVQRKGASKKGAKNIAAAGSEKAGDKLLMVANHFWSPNAKSSGKGKYSAALVSKIYKEELNSSAPSSLKGNKKFDTSRRLQVLDVTCYLENYLWPNFHPSQSSVEHLMSIVLLANEKFSRGMNFWSYVEVDGTSGSKGATQFSSFFTTCQNFLMGSWPATAAKISFHERTAVTLIFINIFQSLEQPLVRNCALRLCSLPLWKSLSPGRLMLELKSCPQLQRHWQHLEDNQNTESSHKHKQNKSENILQGEKNNNNNAQTFLPQIITEFIQTAESCSPTGPLPTGLLSYLERSLELFIDLLSQLPTRRFLHAVFLDMKILERCSLSPLGSTNKENDRFEDGRLFRQLLDMYEFYLGFEINDQTGKPLSGDEVVSMHQGRLHTLQRLTFKYYRELLPELPFASMREAGSRSYLESTFKRLPDDSLFDLARRLRLVSAEEKEKGISRNLVTQVLVNYFAERPSQLALVNEMPLIPSETLLWDVHQVPSEENYSGQTMALPKLNLQFLTLHDYLLRSFSLFRLESAYEIREDLEDAVKRVNPTLAPPPAFMDEEDATSTLSPAVLFKGWARMAVPIDSLEITEVKRPRLGEKVPAEVRANLCYSIGNFSPAIKAEWDSLREHDVLFLLTLRGPPVGKLGHELTDVTFMDRYGLTAVRGGEVIELRDESDNVMNEFFASNDKKKGNKGVKRTIKLHLDTAQYHADAAAGAGFCSDLYESLNLIVRRDPKENNFKGVLETMRDLMNTAIARISADGPVGTSVPSWLHDIFLGYGDPAGAHYRSLPQQLCKNMDFRDTFLDAGHISGAFPSAKTITFVRPDGELAPPDQASPPFSLDFEADTDGGEGIIAREYRPGNPGPYPADIPKKNSVRFTPVQVEAIRSGMNPGLTMVVGPPGTGKTDVAVQVIANLYHLGQAGHRTLLVAHSNAALNDLFEKIMERDIDERHLLRLGAGEKELATSKDFSKAGRVNYTLSRRLKLLEEVSRLATSLIVEGKIGGPSGLTEAAGHSCDTALHFQLYHVTSRIEAFEYEIASMPKPLPPDSVFKMFPFSGFFANAPKQPLFTQEDGETDLATARGCFRHLARIFEELAEYRAFELLRTQSARADYLLTKQARIVAMTCTHAALLRRRLVQLAFKYDSLVMEEAGQILEVETLIPMLLQDQDMAEGGDSRLKRVVLIGDHHQLPPVVQCQALQRHAHLDQSLFSRFIRLGTPSVQLDAQGRARPALAALYSWRYKSLGNLPNVSSGPYLAANAGFAKPFQMVDVGDFQGKGETTPTAHFYQNLGEAEYVVACYQYMRLLGYPSDKIAILATYNGQRALILDILRQRCQNSAIFGMPSAVQTVDKYQGQQSDYVLLSLVRTKRVGHIRDVRRLVVALSRARLGLYIFCRRELFENCAELAPALSQLLPPKLGQSASLLSLAPGESWPSYRPVDPPLEPPYSIPIMDVTQMGVLVHQMAQAVLSNMAIAAQAQAQYEAFQAAAKASQEAEILALQQQAEAELEAKRKAEVAAITAEAMAGNISSGEQSEDAEQEDTDEEDSSKEKGMDSMIAE